MEKESIKKHGSPDFYVVGIGASSGGLEAIQTLFDNIPDDTGMAFVIVQHLSPTFKSMMDELLSKHTKMPVQLATNDIELKPNNVYLNPKEKNIILENGFIKYVEKSNHHPLNLPIDLFFHSLGNSFEENAIGIILSGTGTDGSRGIATIKGAGGTVIVQKPETAQFDGMPATAINSGNAEFIATPEEIGTILDRITSNFFFARDQKNLSDDEEGFNQIIEILYKFSGVDFKLYKNSTLLRRIEKRVAIKQLSNFKEYAGLLSKDAKEQELLVKDCLIGVTRYFRDFEAFEALKKSVLPYLFSKKRRSDLPVRIWVTACSTGEEAYSIATVIDDYLRENKINLDYKIFATDISKESIQIAAEGKYPVNYVADIPKKILEKYFIKSGDSFEIIKRIREKIVFSRHNLLKDPPFIKMDMISCRNLLIYLLPKVQYKVIGTFQFGLNKGGYLFLGHSETLGDSQKMFKTIDTQWRIYQSIAEYKELPSRMQTDLRLKSYESTHSAYGFQKIDSPVKTNPEKIFTEILASKYGPSSVFVNTSFEILYINGDINDYVVYRPGMIRNILLDILVDDKLKAMVRNGVRRAQAENKKIVFKDIPFSNKEKKALVLLTFRQFELNATNDEKIILISFEKEKSESQIDDSIIYDQYKLDEFSKQRIEDLEAELKKTKQELQNTIEELETSNEELQASNEELQASNEELQSTNEELQSVNEELYTVNAEVQVKNKELIELNDDVTNILDSTEIATLFLDADFRIRKFTPALRAHFSLTEKDLGRPIVEFASYFSEKVRKEFISDTKKVLEKGNSIEKEFQDDKGKYYLRKTSPFLTRKNEIDGVVISFVDISQIHETELELRKHQNYINSIYKAALTGIYVYNIKKGANEFINSRYTEILGYTLEEINSMSGEKFLALFHPNDQQAIAEHMKIVTQLKKGEIESIEYRFKSKGGDWIWCYSYDTGYEYDEDGNMVSFVGSFLNITEQKRRIFEIENAKKLNDTLFDSSPFGIILYNDVGECIKTNEMAAEFLGGSRSQILNQNIQELASWKTANLYKDAQQTLNTGKKTSGIEQVKTTFGKEFWMEYFFVRFTYNNNPHLLFKFNNVNSRVKEQLQLKESEIRYKNMFYDNKSVMLLIDPESSRIVDANKAAVKYYGYQIEQIKKMNINEINTLSEKEIKEEIQNAKTDKKGFFQFKHKLSNGKIRNVQVYSGKILVDEKEVLYSIIHDNTNEIQALEKLKKQTIELIQSEKMSALGTLIAGVAHELNNPLMGILNYTDYALKHVPKNNKAFPVLTDLKEEAEKSADIVKGLLTFSRKEKAGINKNYKTDLGKAINAVMKILALKMKNKNIDIHLPKTNGEFVGNINLSYLQQVIFNVLDNAIYAVENTDKKEIKIDIKKQVKHNVIIISDSGVGISTEQNNTIFDPFFTTKPVGEGTGLGLSICKNILNDIGGDISFKSKLGNGTTFTLKIPVSNIKE